MRLRSIGTKLTLWYTGILSLTLLVLGTTAYGLLSYSLAQDVDASLRGLAEVIVTRIQEEGRTPLPPDLDKLFRRFFGYAPAKPYFDMLDPSGRQRSGRPPFSTEIPISPEALHNFMHGMGIFETRKGAGPYPVRILTQPILEDGQMVSFIQVWLSLENMYKTRRRFVLIMAAMFPLGLLLAGGGGWLLARRALSPVDHMTKSAQRISGEHLDERLLETGTGDELDRLAKTLNEMLSRLDDSFRQVRRFSADASHELQTPLTILKGEIEVALRSPRSPEEYQRVLHSCQEEIDRISRLVEGLLLLSRADSGVLRLDLKPLDLHQLLAEVSAQMQRLAANRGVTLSLNILEPAIVSGDREHLLRLLLNLIDNAIKYTPNGGRVALSLCTADGQARISVADTGIGLSPAEQAQIFTRFYRAADARSQSGGGAGLGLCIAQSIAEAHGGAIQVQSSPGQGSTFTVVLPLQDQAQVTATAEGEEGI